MESDLSLVRTVISDLEKIEFQVMLIGGWAEELQGIGRARPHGDIDLVLLDPVLEEVYAFVSDRHEVVQKRLSQKRAYLAHGVLVELFLAHWNGVSYQTTWWGKLRWSWDADMRPCIIAGIPVASRSVLRRFRDAYSEIIAARPW